MALARATQVSEAIAAFETFLARLAAPRRGPRGARLFHAAERDVSPRVRASAAEGRAAVER